ncbi:MAG: hypothetical protein HN576_05730 [Bacteriovoracaceae bacterium]|nr:hypothetical protein [Bacteriovoracaceae bacterium]
MKQFYYILILTCLVFGASCSSIIHYTSDSAYKNALKQSFEESSSENMGRAIASKFDQLKQINFDINKLRSFQVLSFPKNSTIAHKNLASDFDLSNVEGMSVVKKRQFYDSLQKYGKPITYEFHAVELQSCYKMIKNRPKHKPEKFFGNAENYRSNQSKKCLVLEAKKRPMINKSNLKPDDIVALRMYFDDDLMPYGKSIDYHDKSESNKIRTVDYRYDQNQSMSSELSEYPVDFPNFSLKSIASNWKQSSENTLNIPTQKYVTKKIKSQVKVIKCNSGYQTSYKDIFGNTVSVGWCKGHSWPTSIHTNRFFSIVKRIK